jgi:putative SOS response-associated peptidase YedK
MAYGSASGGLVRRRVSLHAWEEELARLYHIPIPKQTDLPISYNIEPSQKVLTIRLNPETQQRSLDALQWGLIPHWAKDPKIPYRTINARAESVDNDRRGQKVLLEDMERIHYS